MALRFAWRAGDNSTDARYSYFGKTGSLLNIGGPSIGVDAGAIGGRSLDCTTTTAARGIYFPGKNFVNGRVFSILWRIKPNYTGTPAAARGGGIVTSGRNSSANHFLNWSHAATTGNIVLTGANDTATIFSSASFGAWSPTSGTWYDLVMTWDGTTTANAMKLYIDAALFGQLTAGAAWDSTITQDMYKVLGYGCNAFSATPASYIEEIAVWDTVIDPTANVALQSGNGLLNGASRTSYVSDVAGATLTSFDGLNSTDPGIANVKNGTSYFINGTSYTGTMSSGGSTYSSSYNWSN